MMQRVGTSALRANRVCGQTGAPGDITASLEKGRRFYRPLKSDDAPQPIVDEQGAANTAADEAINELKHRRRHRRRIERDTLLGVGGVKLTDAYSRRIAKKLFTVSRWAAMERALNECGYSQTEIERNDVRTDGGVHGE